MVYLEPGQDRKVAALREVIHRFGLVSSFFLVRECTQMDVAKQQECGPINYLSVELLWEIFSHVDDIGPLSSVCRRFHNESIRFVSQIKERAPKITLYCQICRQMIGQNKLDQTLQIAKGVQDLLVRTALFESISKELLQQEDIQTIKKGKEVADNIIHQGKKSETLLLVADRLIDKGHVLEALEVARGVPESLTRHLLIEDALEILDEGGGF